MNLSALGMYLRDHRDAIVREKMFLVENYDPTYGLQDPKSDVIEYVDFDALIEAIDDFARSFK